MKNPLIWIFFAWMLLLTAAVRPVVAAEPAAFDAPVTSKVSDTTHYAFIADATDDGDHGAWIQYRVKCYGNPGPCEFGGMEAQVYEADGTLRVGDVPRFNYSPHSDAWEAYGWHGCIFWSQQGLLRFCGPNGVDLTTSIGGMALRPWRNLELAPNECYRQGACAKDAYHTFMSSQVAVGDCDSSAPSRYLTVCGMTSNVTMLRVENQGSGGSALEIISGQESAYITLGTDGTLTIMARQINLVETPAVK